MKEKIKVVQYGTGKMSKYSMRYVLEHGAEIVGAIDVNPDIIGKDIGEIIGCDEKGIKITHADKAEELLKSIKPDICIVTTMSLLKDVEKALKLCASLGINAITTCEEAFFSENSNPNLTEEINKLAIENNCTIAGSGYQDIYWGELISAICASSNKITKIKGSSSYNVEDYGIALAKAHGSGLTLEQFDKEIASIDRMSKDVRQDLIDKGNYSPSYMWNVNGWLASKLGLTVTHQTQKCVPQIAKKAIKSTTLGMTIPKGACTGMSAVVTTETKEGIVIESECIGKVYDSTEFDCNDWTVEGEPNTRVVIERPATVELTCASVVNRIPDVLMAPAGYFTTEYMPENFYKTQNLDKYVLEYADDCCCGGDCECHHHE